MSPGLGSKGRKVLQIINPHVPFTGTDRQSKKEKIESFVVDLFVLPYKPRYLLYVPSCFIVCVYQNLFHSENSTSKKHTIRTTLKASTYSIQTKTAIPVKSLPILLLLLFCYLRMVVEKGQPPLRIWELNENSTRYDNLVAAPSDEDLIQYWLAWAGVASFVGIFTLIVFLGVLSSRKALRNPFNVYLLYLMVPDIMFSLLCGITCTLNAVNGEYWSSWMCNFQQWYCVFGIGANAWLNAVITQQLHTMLRFSHQRRRYKSPTRIQVSKQALAVYFYCAFLGTWGLIDNENFPYHTGLTVGLACLPIERDTQSTIFFWLCFFPLFVGIPVVYVVYVCYDVMVVRKLLPPKGKRRVLSVYFFRLIMVFLIMWLPTFIVLFVAAPWLPTWAHFAGGTWSHLQGAVSAVVSLFKPDIWNAVQRFLTCQCGIVEERDSDRRRAGISGSNTRSSQSIQRSTDSDMKFMEDPFKETNAESDMDALRRLSLEHCECMEDAERRVAEGSPKEKQDPLEKIEYCDHEAKESGLVNDNETRDCEMKHSKETASPEWHEGSEELPVNGARDQFLASSEFRLNADDETLDCELGNYNKASSCIVDEKFEKLPSDRFRHTKTNDC
jgi:hypothetical protein